MDFNSTKSDGEALFRNVGSRSQMGRGPIPRPGGGEGMPLVKTGGRGYSIDKVPL
jgi:hypothetical protein